MSDTLIEAKRKLGREAADIIADGLHIEKWDGKKGCCPFHDDSTPSMIWCDEDKHGNGNYFRCFGCSKKIDIIDYFMLTEELTFLEAASKLCEMTGHNFNAVKEKVKREDTLIDYKYPKPSEKLTYDMSAAYLGRRKISSDTLEYANIKDDTSGNIVFEYRDIDNTLLSVKYRPSHPITKGHAKMWFQKDADNCPVLFNMHKVDFTKPLICTEGEIDCLSVIEAGEANVVSIPYGANDTTWIEFNYEWLEQFDKIVLWFDNDVAGKKAVQEIIPRLGRHRTYYVEPDKETIDELKYAVSQKRIVSSKCDANNVLIACGKNTVLRLINEAKDMPVKDVYRLLESNDFNINETEIIPTGIYELDNYIYGYVMGTLNIWTGRTGSGKSTLIAQSCINQAIDNGYKAFVFSGELTTPQLKSWIITQLAGRKHLIRWDNGANKPVTYSVTYEAKRAIEEAYMDDIYVYDSYMLTTIDDLIERMEYTRKKHGVRCFIIDNMLTLDMDVAKYKSELTAQTNTIMKLCNFAVKNDCFVHLVAHARKADYNNDLNEEDILGSSSTSKLAMRIFSADRFTDEQRKKNGVPYHACVKVLKDRLLGVRAKKVGLYYDKASRRLYGDKDDINKSYKWDNGSIAYTQTSYGTNGVLLSAYKEDANNDVFG